MKIYIKKKIDKHCSINSGQSGERKEATVMKKIF